MLPMNTPTSAYFSLHEGPKHNNLPPSFPSGNRIESWFKGVYGDADPYNTESCDPSTDSESTLYYDADSEMSEEDLEFTDSDSVSFTSYTGSDFYEWHGDPGPCTYDPIFDPVMGWARYYTFDSDPDAFTDSDSVSFTSYSRSDFREWHADPGPCYYDPIFDPVMGCYTSDSDPDSYFSDSDLGSNTLESGLDTSHSFNGLRMPAFEGSYTSTSDMGSHNSDSDPDNYIWESDETDSLKSASGSGTRDFGIGLWVPSMFHGLNNFSGAYESASASPSSSDNTSGSNTDIYSSDSASRLDSGLVVASMLPPSALQARLLQRLRLQMAESRARIQESRNRQDQLRNASTVLTRTLN